MAVTTDGRFEMLNELKLNCLKARIVGNRTYTIIGEAPLTIAYQSPLEDILLTTPTTGTTSLTSNVQFDVLFDNLYAFEEIIISGLELFNSAGDTIYLTASFAQNFVYQSEGFFNLTALNITML
jgi:hypothetical protein